MPTLSSCLVILSFIMIFENTDLNFTRNGWHWQPRRLLILRCCRIKCLARSHGNRKLSDSNIDRPVRPSPISLNARSLNLLKQLQLSKAEIPTILVTTRYHLCSFQPVLDLSLHSTRQHSRVISRQFLFTGKFLISTKNIINQQSCHLSQ